VKFLFVGGPKNEEIIDVGETSSQFIEIPCQQTYTNDTSYRGKNRRNLYSYELVQFHWKGIDYPIYIYIGIHGHSPSAIANLLVTAGYMNKENK
jgi:hypothetical protein